MSIITGALLSVIPPKLWRLNIDPPDGSTASFDVDERWWDQVELTRLDLSSNEIKEMSLKILKTLIHCQRLRCSVDGCISYKFSPVEEVTFIIRSLQAIMTIKRYTVRMQEHVQKLGIGYIPRFVWVVLERDLVDSCKAGNDVIVTGIVRQQWKSLNGYIHANHIVLKTSSQDKNDITDEIKSFFDAFWCSYKDNPLEGHNYVYESGTRVRGDCHLLLVGDPGIIYWELYM
uniref:MCM OB domain-containing protein n=2 Tax=Amphimedon queenslandica TaxID=400682 RepID=A0A1X7TR58_AMPQE